ncbi:hypothetical protein D3C75_738680 [compost metagenome]
MQYPLHRSATHHWLEEQFEMPIVERLVQPLVPGMLAIRSNCSHALFKAYPTRRWLVLGAGQGFVGKLQQCLW